MEYRLNKIDPEVRQKVFDKTSSGKVHSKNSIAVNKDKNEEKREREWSFKDELEKKEKHKKLYVQAVKVQNIEVIATKENESKDEVRGLVIDTKK